MHSRLQTIQQLPTKRTSAPTWSRRDSKKGRYTHVTKGAMFSLPRVWVQSSQRVLAMFGNMGCSAERCKGYVSERWARPVSVEGCYLHRGAVDATAAWGALGARRRFPGWDETLG